jgi:hypothetical protein
MLPSCTRPQGNPGAVLYKTQKVVLVEVTMKDRVYLLREAQIKQFHFTTYSSHTYCKSEYETATRKFPLVKVPLLKVPLVTEE